MKNTNISKQLKHINESSKVFTASALLIFLLFIIDRENISNYYIQGSIRILLTLLLTLLFPINFTREILKFKESSGYVTYNHEISFAFLNMIFLGLFYFIKTLKFLNLIAITISFLAVIYVLHKLITLKPNHYKENIKSLLAMSLFLLVFFFLVTYIYSGPVYFA